MTTFSRGIFNLEASSAGRPAEFSAKISSSGVFRHEVTRQATTRRTFSQTRLLREAALGWTTRSRHFAERFADLLYECDPAEKSQKILENAKGGTHLFSDSDTTGKSQVTTPLPPAS